MELIWIDTHAGVFPSCPENFWIEIRDFQCAALECTIAEVPSAKLPAGTDWTTRTGPPFQPYGTMFDVPENENRFAPRVASLVQFLLEANASDESVARIASGNALELYGLAA